MGFEFECPASVNQESQTNCQDYLHEFNIALSTQRFDLTAKTSHYIGTNRFAYRVKSIPRDDLKLNDVTTISWMITDVVGCK